MNAWIRRDARPEELLEVAVTEMIYEKVEDRASGEDANVQLRMSDFL